MKDKKPIFHGIVLVTKLSLKQKNGYIDSESEKPNLLIAVDGDNIGISCEDFHFKYIISLLIYMFYVSIQTILEERISMMNNGGYPRN